MTSLPEPRSQDSSSDEDSPPVAAALDSILRLLRRGLTVLALLYLCSGVTFIGAGDSALVLRLGKVLPRVAPPGLLLAWPRPFDRVVLVPGKRVVELELDEWKPGEEPPSEMGGLFPDALVPGALHPVKDGYSLTGDRNILRGSFTIRYRVVDPKAYALGIADPDLAIRNVAYRAITRCLAGESVDGALLERRQQLASSIVAVAQSLAENASLGIAFEAFEIRELSPPATVLVAFQQVIDAQILAETAVNEALDEKALLLPSAEARAHRVRAEAEAEAQARIVRAGAEAGAFRQVLAATGEDPADYRLRRLSETRKEIWSGLKSINVLPTGENPVQLFLPAAGTPFSFQARPTTAPESFPEDEEEMTDH